GDRRIWRLLNIPPPSGVVAGPDVFSGWSGTDPGASPPFLVSLFLQYKRATYLTRSWANEWKAHSQEYWRVELPTRQRDILADLEQSAGANAVVRYAAPRFWEHEDMWRLQVSGGVLDNSLFFSPSDVKWRHDRVTWSRTHGLIGHSEEE